jgi:inorganic triphosphatase YgiF
MTENMERELKLVPLDQALLGRLASLTRLGPFQVSARRHETQRNAFFDTPNRALRAARIGFRRRSVEGERMARWTLKANGELVGGLANRVEIELALDPELVPALAIGTLRDAARSRGAVALAETVDDALARGGLPTAQPFVETETDRTIIDLEEPNRGWRVELALDRMRVLGTDYADVEIEAELKRGDDEALASVRRAIAELGETRDSRESKLSRALRQVSRSNQA